MAGRPSRVSIRIKAAAAALFTVFAVAAVGSTGAQAASLQGGPITTEFNYVGINVTALGNPLNELILTPDSLDAENNPLLPLTMNGTYSDTNGNFTLPKVGGLDFPKLVLDISGIPISGTGPLKCQIAPLNVSFSTNPVNWPAPGALFTDKTSATPASGAVAGSWNTKPKVVSLVQSNAALCPIIGGLLEPVGVSGSPATPPR